jgi:4-amino-4-deoxy-L-arabinose transferase-like glycosyltransferase
MHTTTTSKASTAVVPIPSPGTHSRHDLIVLTVAALIYLSCIVSPPYLLDDVDAVQAQIARNMLESGDWVTARLNGVPYLEKAPLIYWLMAGSYSVFGVADWAARLPVVLGVLALCWATARFGRWAFGSSAGLYAGLAITASVGLFLFTRILIPDALLTLTITLALWAFLRLLENESPRFSFWTAVLGACLGLGLLLKGLIAVVFPVAIMFVYLLLTRQLAVRETWRRLRPGTVLLLALAVALPWHVLAILRNPPYFDFTMRSVPGEYRGFFWFYFLNEHLFRYLGTRYPRDYDTVPRLWFWLLHLVWLFPWSMYFPAVARGDWKPATRPGRVRLLALCWVGVVMIFFSFSTTQEYYSLPIYPALALLLGSAMAGGGKWVERGTRVLVAICALAALAAAGILAMVWNTPTPGDISQALTVNPELYRLSLGHMGDLTLTSFAYLRFPLMLTLLTLSIGAILIWRMQGKKRFIAIAAMMAGMLVTARIAMVAFDPYLSSRQLAVSLMRAPTGNLIVDQQYYTFSSVFFYTNRTALLLNGRVTTFVYGSHAPGAPHVFLDDEGFEQLWQQPGRRYLLIEGREFSRLEQRMGSGAFHRVAESGGKLLLSNQPVQGQAALSVP